MCEYGTECQENVAFLHSEKTQYNQNILESTAVILLPICFLNGAWKTESSHHVFAVV